MIKCSWNLARHQELVPEEGVGLSGLSKAGRVASLEFQRRRLAEAVSKKQELGALGKHFQRRVHFDRTRGSPQERAPSLVGETSNRSRKTRTVTKQRKERVHVTSQGGWR